MKTWSYGVNSHPDHRLGIIILYSRPWWLSLVEWLAFAVGWRWLNKIKLPDWPKITWTDIPGDDKYSPQEWWGDVGQIVGNHVTAPLVQWVWAHPRNQRTEIHLGYERLREIFYEEDPETFDRDEGLWRLENFSGIDLGAGTPLSEADGSGVLAGCSGGTLWPWISKQGGLPLSGSPPVSRRWRLAGCS